MKRLAAVALTVLAGTVPAGTVPLAYAAFRDTAAASSTFTTVDVAPPRLTVTSCGALLTGGQVTFDMGASSTAGVSYALTRTNALGSVKEITVSVPGTVQDTFAAVLGDSYTYRLRATTAYGWYDEAVVTVTWVLAGCSIS